jgi:hypothetical protein
MPKKRAAITPVPSKPKESDVKYFSPESHSWECLTASTPQGADHQERQGIEAQAKTNSEQLKALLLSSLQMQHVVVLAGSGTSLGPVGGPSMVKLWEQCVNTRKSDGSESPELTDEATAVIHEIGYSAEADGHNIEALLSRCEAFLQVKDSTNVESFLRESKRIILDECSKFLKPNDPSQLESHRVFLHRLSRRRGRDSRMKLFTTNYDLCFERAAGKLGLVALDGFSFTYPRHFDPRYFLFDIVRRPITGEDAGAPLEGVFHLYKLHGSVNWARTQGSGIEIVETPEPDQACMIYPAKGKYQQSYIQPHLELMSQYLASLREPNTCLVVVGFGFNDDHLSEPILAAVKSNPHLRLIIVNRSAEENTQEGKENNRYWKELFQLANQGEDVWLINATFGEFAERIPDLKSLTAAERLSRDIQQITGAR